MITFNKRKRDEYEIYLDILSACKRSISGISKTRLMYAANLTFEVANKYIPILEEKNLIEKRDNLYFITSKGEDVLRTLQLFREKKHELKEILRRLKEELGR
jgi:predicted transcriptional regulator